MTLCWWCCHEFPGETLHLPYKHDPLRNKFQTTGTFCSWGCMKSFALDRYGTNHGGIMCMNILSMRKQMTGELGRVTKAPDRYALKAFGGTMTIEEFRTVSADAFPLVNLPNESYRIQTVGTKTVLQEAISNKPSMESNAVDKMAAIQSSSTYNEPLRLKRPKPLKRDQNNLESTLGIVRKKK